MIRPRTTTNEAAVISLLFNVHMHSHYCVETLYKSRCEMIMRSGHVLTLAILLKCTQKKLGWNVFSLYYDTEALHYTILASFHSVAPESLKTDLLCKQIPLHAAIHTHGALLAGKKHNIDLHLHK